MSQSPLIVFTGGGTAGHVAPNLALFEPSTPLGEALLQNQVRIHYFGSRSGLEKAFLASCEQVKYQGIFTGKLRRYWHWKNFTDPFFFFLGFLQSLFFFIKERPQFLFSKGGFCAVPVVWAAFCLRIPIWIHEGDASLSLSSKLTLPFAEKGFSTFPQVASSLITPLGLPIRPSLQKGEALALFKRDLPVLLVMGGSLGSKHLNEILWTHIEDILSLFNVIHLTGPNTFPPQNLWDKEGYAFWEIYKNMGEIYETSHLFLGRAGASTLFEALAFDLSLILVPLPLTQSRGDQIQNSLFFEKHQGATLLPEENLERDLIKILRAKLPIKTSKTKRKDLFQVAHYLSQKILSRVIP